MRSVRRPARAESIYHTTRAPAQRHDVLLWIDDALDLRLQRLERAALLLEILVPVVGATHAAHDVAEASLGMIVEHAGAAHQRACGAPQVVQRPAGDAGSPIEAALGLRKVPDRTIAAVGE